MTSSGTCSAESASGVGSSEFRLELVEPLLSAGYALWTLAATPTRVGFTADCDIVVDLDHVSRDMKFRRHDTFVISFIEEKDEWTVQMLMADVGGGFKKNYHYEQPEKNLTLPKSGGRFWYSLPLMEDEVFRNNQNKYCRSRGQLRFRIVELAKEKDRFSTYVDHMPTEVLGRVVSFLGEEDILDGFLPAYRVLGGELHHRVPWGTIGDENGEGRYVDMLSVLRGLMLAETASTANFVVHWKPEDEGMYRKWKNILASESLRRVVVFDPSVLLGQTVSNEVRTLKIFLTLDSSEDVVWSWFDKNVFVPRRLEKVEIDSYMDDGFQDEDPMSLVSGGAEFSALFSDVRKLYFMNTNPHSEFWNGFQASNYVVVDELSVVCQRWFDHPVPLNRFVNVTKLRLTVLTALIEELPDPDHVVMPQVQEIQVYVSTWNDYVFRKRVWERIARFVPNVVNLIIERARDAWAYRLCPHDLFAVTIPDRFRCLQKLNLDNVMLGLNSVMDMVDRFEAIRPGSVKEVNVAGSVFYATTKCLKVCGTVARWVKRKHRENPNATLNVSWRFPVPEPERPPGWNHDDARSRYVFTFSQL